MLRHIFWYVSPTMLRRVMSQGPACLLIGSVGPCKRGLVLIVDFPVEPSLLLDQNPRWRSHLLSRIEADPLVGFAWSAWSSCYHSGASLGFLVEIPPLLIVFFGSTGGRTSLLLGFGLHLLLIQYLYNWRCWIKSNKLFLTWNITYSDLDWSCET